MRVKMPVPLLFAHKGIEVPIGDVFMVSKSEHQVYVRALIFEDNAAADHAWLLIEAGEVRALSVSRTDQHLQGIVDGISFYDRWRLKEVSICRRGANPQAYFEILK